MKRSKIPHLKLIAAFLFLLVAACGSSGWNLAKSRYGVERNALFIVQRPLYLGMGSGRYHLPKDKGILYRDRKAESRIVVPAGCRLVATRAEKFGTYNNGYSAQCWGLLYLDEESDPIEVEFTSVLQDPMTGYKLTEKYLKRVDTE